MPKTFTDSEGRKYEYVGELTGAPPIEGGSIIRPVKEKPKWLVSMEGCFRDEFDHDVTAHFLGTKDQAQLIKEAVEALMEFLLGNEGKHIDELAGNFYSTRMALKETE